MQCDLELKVKRRNCQKWSWGSWRLTYIFRWIVKALPVYLLLWKSALLKYCIKVLHSKFHHSWITSLVWSYIKTFCWIRLSRNFIASTKPITQPHGYKHGFTMWNERNGKFQYCKWRNKSTYLIFLTSSGDTTRGPRKSVFRTIPWIFTGVLNVLTFD